MYFVSNLPWHKPVVYPNAAVTIPLHSLKPKDLQPVETRAFSGTLWLLNTMDGMHATDLLDPYALLFMRDDHGRIYAGVQNRHMSSLPPPFLEIAGENFTAGYFQDVLGYNGFTISYTGADGYPACDYYFLTKDGEPVLLAHCGRDVQLVDLDNDGERELVSCPGYGAQLVFRRDGNIYEANLRALIQEAWPEAEAISFDGWDPVNRCLGLSAFAPYDTSDGYTQLEGVTRTAFRCLYYDGADLLLTEDPRSPGESMNHMMGRYDAPAEVVDAARNLAESEFNRRQSEGFDDWRVSTLLGPYEEIADGKRFEIWQVDYELHTPSPEVLSGSAHLSEPTWTVPRRPNYLIFQTDRDGNRTLFTTFIQSDSAPGTQSFRISLLNVMIELDSQTLLNVEGVLSWKKCSAINRNC